MRINLPTNDFSFFKFLSGTLILLTALIFPFFTAYSYIIPLMVGRAHTLGAWLGMWRAGKLNWIYVTWMIALTVSISYWGLALSTIATLTFVTNLFFTFHFLFDEFYLQEEQHTLGNVLSMLSPFVLLYIFLIGGFFASPIPFALYLAIAGTFLVVEMIYLEEMNWFFFHSKILTLFVLISIYLGKPSWNIIGILLIFHYFFWFIYPVHRLHKSRPEERNGFIMILLLLVGTSIYFSFTRSSYGPEILEVTLRTFLIGTLIHILGTAPFGYFFGLPRQKRQLKAHDIVPSPQTS